MFVIVAEVNVIIILIVLLTAVVTLALWVKI